jgi:O-acetyl-ADP-ribose deacetylase (regulator of RNase III)
MPLTIVRNDITKMGVDAIVNAANSGLSAGTDNFIPQQVVN